jgi:hypothetical protein
MSTLDEITKEKQRVSEALARVDAQREKLTSQLNELQATERVLTRYEGTRGRKMATARTSTAATNKAGHQGRASGSRPQDRLAAGAARSTSRIRFLRAQRAGRSMRLLPHAKELGRTMSAPRSPGTSGRATSRSAAGNFTQHSYRHPISARRSDTRSAAVRWVYGDGPVQWRR